MTKLVSVLMLVTILMLTGCASVQDTVAERNAAIGYVDKSNYYEAQQIAEIEEWKDRPGKIVFLYMFPPNVEKVIVVQCKGVPTSSTESLEPNYGAPTASGSRSVEYYNFAIPDTDGGDQTIVTNELAGRDGSFGEPVPYRQCISIDGEYYDLPNMSMPYFVSSASYVFPMETVKRDIETEIRLMQAEQIIKNGGCVNPETLEKADCN